MGKNYQVHFSKGILQYHAEKKITRFAKNQFDNPGRKYTDFCHYPPKAWIDHFEHGSLSEIACPCLSWDRDEALYGNGYNLDANAIEKIGERNSELSLLSINTYLSKAYTLSFTSRYA